VPTTVEYRHHKPSYYCHEMTTCGNNIMCTINYAVESISIIAYHIYSRHYDVMKFSVTFYRDFFQDLRTNRTVWFLLKRNDGGEILNHFIYHKILYNIVLYLRHVFFFTSINQECNIIMSIDCIGILVFVFKSHQRPFSF